MTFEINVYDESNTLASSCEVPSAGALQRHLSDLCGDVVDTTALASQMDGEAPLASAFGVVQFGPVA